MTLSPAVRADALLLWDYLQMHHEPRPCSVAIALGSHDLGVADVAADLYLRGFAPLIVMTGATSPTSKARMPRGEAVHYRERALELGVPEDAILVEPEAGNTGENISFTRALLEEREISATSALLVSKPYEERRAYATANKLWPEADWVCVSAPMTFSTYIQAIGDARLVMDMMVGTQQRLIVYPQLGFTVPQQVPDEVSEAYARLVAEGLTSRLIRG